VPQISAERARGDARGASGTEPERLAETTKPADKPAEPPPPAEAAAVSAEPEPVAEPPAPTEPFNKTAASAALDGAAAEAAGCRKPGDPSGIASVVVTFAPSGRVTTATVSGLFAGTPTGGCVAAKLRAARIPAFAGDHTTVSKTVVIQ
jgi:hypothetical protein